MAAEALHVTLAFLGHRPEADAGRAAAAAFAAARDRSAPTLRPGAVRPLPPRRPRLFALDLEDEAGRAAELQGAVAAALAAAELFRPERRPFWAHVTLARVRGGRPAAPLEAPGPPGTPFVARRLTLYRSILRPDGARYEPLERLALSA